MRVQVRREMDVVRGPLPNSTKSRPVKCFLWLTVYDGVQHITIISVPDGYDESRLPDPENFGVLVGECETSAEELAGILQDPSIVSVLLQRARR